MLKKSPVRIYDYTDFRAYLAEYYRAVKALDPRFSHRQIHAEVGSSSSGWFSDILKGRISLTGTYRMRLVRLLGLSRHETEYFESMVGYSQAASLEEKSRMLEKLLSFKEVPADVLGREKFAYYAQWHHAALRELLFVRDPRIGPKALGRMLIPPLGDVKVRRSLELLRRLDLIREDADGRLRPTAAILRKDPSYKSVFLTNFLRANMQLAMESLERIPVDERDISALTLILAESDIPRVREEIKSLRKRLLAWSESAAGKARVYQCNFQLFPVST